MREIEGAYKVVANAVDGNGRPLWKCSECQTLVDPWDRYCKYCGCWFIPKGGRPTQAELEDIFREEK